MKNLCFALCLVLVFNTNQAFGAEGGMPQLNPEFWASQIFWLILIFSGLYIVIWKIFLPKVTDSIENRKSRILGISNFLGNIDFWNSICNFVENNFTKN